MLKAVAVAVARNAYGRGWNGVGGVAVDEGVAWLGVGEAGEVVGLSACWEVKESVPLMKARDGFVGVEGGIWLWIGLIKAACCNARGRMTEVGTGWATVGGRVRLAAGGAPTGE